MPAFVSPDAIRSAFSEAMSAMYRAEVPLYGTLLAIVATVNDATLAADPALAAQLEAAGEIARLSGERHGAIRVGTAGELAALRRAFAVMGMHPVGYYDLAPAGVPVHSTAFRPIEAEALAASPFRVFTSLLRPELIEDAALREQAHAILARRHILSDATLTLIDRAEHDGGLAADDADAFVAGLLETFRWQGRASVDLATYRALNAAHRLIADIVSFQGPHINHLTPRTLDIDAAQAEMRRRGIATKAVIEGPPRRAVPILLRQTSFRALDETILFGDAESEETGSHTARFGEIEQRGAALTRTGRAMYDACLESARTPADTGEPYDERLAAAFAGFPDEITVLRREGLAWFRYAVTEAGRAAAARGETRATALEEAIATGWVSTRPIIYEDFLPVSAAGIFQSNLAGDAQQGYAAQAAQAAFEAALGRAVRDPFALYEAEQAASLATVHRALGLAPHS